MTTVNASPPPASPAQSAEVDISIFTPAALREPPKEEPKNEGTDPQPAVDETPDADVHQPADDGASGSDDGGADDGGADDGEDEGKRKRSTATASNA